MPKGKTSASKESGPIEKYTRKRKLSEVILKTTSENKEQNETHGSNENEKDQIPMEIENTSTNENKEIEPSKEENEDSLLADNYFTKPKTQSKGKGKPKGKTSPDLLKQKNYKYSLDKLLEDKLKKDSEPPEPTVSPISSPEKERKSKLPESEGSPGKSSSLSARRKKVSQGKEEKKKQKEQEPMFEPDVELRITQLLALPQEEQVKVDRIFTKHVVLPEIKLVLKNYHEDQAEQQLLKNLANQDGATQRELICGGWIANWFQNTSTLCPKSVVKWLYSIIAYSLDAYLATSAFLALETLITSKQPSCNFILLSYPHSGPEQLHHSTTSNWTPNFKLFMRTFKAYGATFDTANNDSNEVNNNNNSISTGFPVKNFSLVIQHLKLCVQHRPERFSDDQIENLIQYICRFLLDPNTATCVIDLESLLAILIAHFSETSWKSQSLSNLCELLSSLKVASNHQNFLKLVQHIPLISQRGKQLQTHLCMHKLPKLFSLKQFSVQPFEQIPVKTLVDMVKQIQAELSATHPMSWTMLHTVISLMDEAINDREIFKQQFDDISLLKSSLKTLNGQIKEVSGYNPSITKAKDKLVFFSTKLTMLPSIIGKKVQKQLQIKTSLIPTTE